jgi:hypothetical protein
MSLSTSATSVRFKTQYLYVSGSSCLTVRCTTGPAWDNFSLLYRTYFDSASPLLNVIIANDDLGNSNVTGFTASGFHSDEQLIFVLTGYYSTSSGTSSCTFTSSGTITLGNAPEIIVFGYTPCTPAVASEEAVLNATGLTCCSDGVVCVNSADSQCHVTVLPYLSIPSPSLSFIALPELISVTNDVLIGSYMESFGTQSISFPKLVDVASFSVSSLANLTTVNLSSLKGSKTTDL